MEMLQIIIIVSIVMWYIIDRFKPMWDGTSYGKYVTIAVSAVFAFGLCFAYNLDMMVAFGLPSAGPVGTILTACTLMGGSSAISELIGKIKGE